MPGASGWPLSLSASSGGCRSARPSTRSISRARQAAGAQQHRLVEAADDGGFDADRDRRRHRRSGRSAPRGRSAHAPPWSARHGPRDWPTAPPPGRRRRAGSPAPPDGRGSGSRRCRGRRWRDRPPRSRPFSAAPASAGPARTPRPARSPPRRSGAIRARGGEIADMGDQRIEGRPALGLVEPGDRRRIGGVGAEAIDGLGRERDQPALGQARARPPPRRPRRRAKSAFSGRHSL